MRKPMKHRTRSSLLATRRGLLMVGLCLAALVLVALQAHLPAQSARPNGGSGNVSLSPAGSSTIDLPLVVRNGLPNSNRPRVNAPYFPVVDVNTVFPQLAVFWFGHVAPSDNYVDVRVGYSDRELYVYLAVVDRRLWVNPQPTPATLTAWDSVSLYLRPLGPAGGGPDANSDRLDAGLYNAAGGALAGYTAAFRGTDTAWAPAAIPFSTLPGWRGQGLNDNLDDRGWSMAFRLPFTSTFGLGGKPADGAVWGLGVAVHNRDDAAGTPIPDEHWPAGFDASEPATWGQLAFGLPAAAPSKILPRGVVTVRQGLNGATVPDAAVGGTVDNLCPGDPSIWTAWGNQNFAGAPAFNIQNEADISDWPCFSKYYVTFPLDQVPANKAIISATLSLHQWSNSGPISLVQPSLVQVLTVGEDWSPASLTWNNAPMALENVSQAWVPAEQCGQPPAWPCAARAWDVSRSTDQAYRAGQPLRLVLYSADAAYSSGKFFTSSDSGDWNAAGRPTLTIAWGEP